MESKFVEKMWKWAGYSVLTRGTTLLLAIVSAIFIGGMLLKFWR